MPVYMVSDMVTESKCFGKCFVQNLLVQLGVAEITLVPPDVSKLEAPFSVNGTHYLATEESDVVVPLVAHDKLIVSIHSTSKPKDSPVIQLTTTLETFKVLYDGINLYVWVSTL